MKYLAAVLSVAAILSAKPAGPALGQEEAQSPARPVVAVMDFTNSALVDHEIYDPFSVGVAGMLLAELGQNPEIELVERERLAEVLEEIELGRSDYVSPESAVRAGRILGAQYIIFGVFAIDRIGNLRLDARAVDVETSKLEHVETVTDDSDNLLRAVQRLGRQLNSTLDLPAGGTSSRDLDSAEPGQVLANLKYARAILEEDRQNTDQAILLYQEFLAESPPGYAMAQRNAAEERIRFLAGGRRP